MDECGPVPGQKCASTAVGAHRQPQGSKVRPLTSALLSYLCVPGYLQGRQDPPPHFLLRRLKWWRELKPQVGRADNRPEPPRTKADSCSRFYKCGMCDLSFLTSPLVLSSCNAPTLAWINNQGPNWSDPPPLQRGRSSRGPPTSLRSP